MTPPRYEKIKEIFSSVLETDPSNRGAYLDKACDGNAELRAEVERLLNSFDEGYMETPAVAGVAEEITRASARSGQMIGHYRLLEMIGCGGMGEVYLAEDGKLGRKVAIKLLPDEVTLDEDRLKRFQLEARSASALNHPNVITIYEIGEWEEGHYIATEFVDGETLRQRLAEGRLSITEALECGVQLAAGIAAAHELGITHRDIKPENIMIRHDGLLKVLDFGLAKHVRPAAAPALAGAAEPTIRMVRTEPGIIMGTLQYMSPEQARGLETDVRTDIWSLGCVLYEMACGSPPFVGGTPADLIAEIMKSSTRPLKERCPEVPERLQEIVSRALEKDPTERYQTSRDLLNDLKQLQKKIDSNPERSRAGLLKFRRLAKGTKRVKVHRTSEKDLATVSSAEYLIWGIKAHRFTTAGIVLVILSLLGATAYLTRRYWVGPNEARMNYANKIKLAAQALDGADLQQAEQLLNETKPGIGEVDLRGFEWGYLAGLLAERNSTRPVSLPHERPVESVAFSPDGAKLATGGIDNAIHLWDVATGQELLTLKGHTASVATISFSPDGKTLLSGSADNTARLWNLETGKQVLLLGPSQFEGENTVKRMIIEGPDPHSFLMVSVNGPVSAPAFIGRGSMIAIVGKSIRTWDLNTGAESKVLISDLDDNSHFAISPDERTLATRMSDQSVRIRSASTGKTLTTLKGHSGLVTELRFSTDSRFIITGSTDGTAKTWDVRTGKNRWTFNHSGEVQDVAFSPDGETVATGGTDDTIKMWSTVKGYHIGTLKGHRDRVLALAFSRDGRKLASGSGWNDNTAKIWNVPVGEPRGVLRGHTKGVTSVIFSSDSKNLISTSGDNSTRTWSISEERQTTILPDSGDMALSPNGRDIAIGGQKAIRIWDLSNGLARRTIDVARSADVLDYSPDGRLLAFGDGDRRVRVLSTDNGLEVCTFVAHTDGAWYVSFTNDDRIVTSSVGDNQVLVWDAKSCLRVSSFAGRDEAWYVTSVTPKGEIRALEVLSNARSLRLVSIVDDGKEIASFSGHEGRKLLDAEFSPKADRLATSSDDETIKIWDSVTGQELLTIKPGVGAIESIAFSPNGEILAAAGSDGTIRLFRSRSSE